MSGNPKSDQDDLDQRIREEQAGLRAGRGFCSKNIVEQYKERNRPVFADGHANQKLDEHEFKERRLDAFAKYEMAYDTELRFQRQPREG